MAVRGTDEEYAAALELDAHDYPEDRGEILLEALSAWRRAGRPDRVREIADDLIAEGGDKACFARVERVELALDEDDWASARTELAALAQQPVLDQHHCLMAAELLVERGALEEGLAWFDRSVARFSQDELGKIATPGGGFSPSAMVVEQRKGVRERLGYPADATDALADARSRDVEALFGEGDLFGQQPSGRSSPRLRMFVFQRAERAEARRRWPDEYDVSDEEHFAALELHWRDLRESGTASIQVVSAPAEELVAFAERTGGSPTDSEVKVRFSRTAPDSATLAWPPERNAPCWCGSGTKYKKCCGRPDPRPS